MKLILLAFVTFLHASLANPPHPLSDDYVDWLNGLSLTWKAGHNFNKNRLESYLYNHKGVLSHPDNPNKYREVIVPNDTVIPEKFDARENWPECKSIGNIGDEGACGSSYVVAPVSCMTDRICIFSEGKSNLNVSVMNGLACSWYGAGCGGGFENQTWDWWVTDGIVTGGWYNTTDGCQSYVYTPCDHTEQAGNGSIYPPCPWFSFIPECYEICDRGSNLVYKNDFTRGKDWYYVDQEVDAIQYEILTNGPVSTHFELCSDFFFYKSGVYQRSPNATIVGLHAVKIIGWGVEDDIPHWLAVNSYNTNWGDQGTFKILRGEDHLRFESYVTAGTPKL